jgi:Ca2+-transporting ATPase
MSDPVTAAGASPAWHALSVEEALAGQRVEPANGLTTAEVEARRAKVGPNTFTQEETESRWHAFLRQYADAMQIVLLVAGILSIFPVKQVPTGVMLILLTVLNAYLGLSQEGKAAAAVAALQKMMVVRARVRRDGELREIPSQELVPGDIVSFEAGDLVTADGRIISAATLEIDEAALTGESLPSSKDVDAVAEDAPLGDRHGMAYMNTNVTRGSGQWWSSTASTEVATSPGCSSGRGRGDAAHPRSHLTNQLLSSRASRCWRDSIGYFIRGPFDAVRDRDRVRRAAIPERWRSRRSCRGPSSWRAHATWQLRSVEHWARRRRSTHDDGTLTLNQMTAVEMAIPGRRLRTGYGIEDHRAGRRRHGRPAGRSAAVRPGRRCASRTGVSSATDRAR